MAAAGENEEAEPAPRCARGWRRAGLALLVAAFAACGSGAPERTEQRHAGLDDFLAAEASSAQRRRVVVIGIDGASWNYLDPLFAAGELPNLARVAREGAVATLRSVACYFTPPAWTSMFTGALPRHHGIYSFGHWDAKRSDFDEVKSTDVLMPPLWELASRAKRRVAAIGVPVTYPATTVEGVLVSGLMTPKRHRPPLALTPLSDRPLLGEPELASFSPPQSAAFEDPLNVLRVRFSDGVDDGVTDYDRVHLHVLRKGLARAAKRDLGRYEFPVGRYSPWVRVRLPGQVEGFTRIRFRAPGEGRVTYQLSPIFERIPGPFTWPPSLAAELSDRFGYYLPHEFLPLALLPEFTVDAVDHARYFMAREPWDLFLYVFGQSDNAHHLVGFAPSVLPVYREIDAFVGEVLAAAADDTVVVIASDHGFGTYDHAVDPNQLLARQGLLIWESPGVIDYGRTLVFHNMWHLHFNDALLSREELVHRGVPVEPGGDPRDALARHLSRIFQELRSDEDEAFPVEVVPIPADAVGDAPDMAVHGADRYWIEFWNVDRPAGAIVRSLTGDDRWKHAPDGILAFWGADVVGGRDLGVVDIQDVAPTLLDLLGLPVADDLDGALLAGLLAPKVDLARPLHRIASYGPRARQAPIVDDPAPFEDTLRALGYVRD